MMLFVTGASTAVRPSVFNAVSAVTATPLVLGTLAHPVAFVCSVNVSNPVTVIVNVLLKSALTSSITTMSFDSSW